MNFGLSDVEQLIMLKCDATKKLLSAWAQQNFEKVHPGIDFSEIEDFSINEEVVFPKDFLCYLTSANGFVLSEECDVLEDNGFEFLPLNSCNFRRGKYLIFCRWPYGLLEYAICLNDSECNGEVVMMGDDPFGYHLANSFSEFVDLYLSDAPDLYNPTAKARVL